MMKIINVNRFDDDDDASSFPKEKKNIQKIIK